MLHKKDGKDSIKPGIFQTDVALKIQIRNKSPQFIKPGKQPIRISLFQEISIDKNLCFEAWKRSSGVGESSDKNGRVGLIEFASGNGPHHLGKAVFGSIKVKSV